MPIRVIETRTLAMLTLGCIAGNFIYYAFMKQKLEVAFQISFFQIIVVILAYLNSIVLNLSTETIRSLFKK